MEVLIGIVVVVGLFYFVSKWDEESKSKKAAELHAIQQAEYSKAVELLEIQKAEYTRSITSLVQVLIAPHIETLCLKFDQTVYKDEYGNYIFDRWSNALDYFIDNVLRKDKNIIAYLDESYPNDPIEEKSVQTNRRIDIDIIIIDAVQDLKDSLSSNNRLSVDVDSLDPVGFERHCLDILNSHGWESRTTKGSGDQGIDIVATHSYVKAVFQCKKYSQPVGNAAVQEIIAGKAFEQADVAAVVSNATYTTSAKQLASTTGVHLLHFSELPAFAERLGLEGL